MSSHQETFEAASVERNISRNAQHSARTEMRTGTGDHTSKLDNSIIDVSPDKLNIARTVESETRAIARRKSGRAAESAIFMATSQGHRSIVGACRPLIP